MADNNTLTIELIFNADGSINEAATTDACCMTLANEIIGRETQRENIANAVAELYDEHLGKAITLPNLSSMVFNKLNGVPELWGTLSDRIKDYIRANLQETRAPDGTITKHDNSLLVVVKGPGGGVRRRSDIPAKTA